jgi:hypothetical protein
MVAHNFYDVRAVRDVGADDEGWYLGSGVLLGQPGFPNGPNGWPIAEQGPLYSFWYFLLSKIWRAPLELYFASWQLLAAAVSVALFVVLRRVGAAWWQALLATFFYVNSVVADVWPFPTYFATLIVLMGVLLAARARTTGAVLACVTCALAAAGFARPELLVAYVPAVLFTFGYVVRERRRNAQRPDGTRTSVLPWFVGVAPIVPGALLCALFGNPLEGKRSYFAFVQHYAVNLLEATHSSRDPWADWGEIADRDFPHTWTLGMAFRQNPVAFFEHVWRNILQLPRAFLVVTDSLDVGRSVQIPLVAIGLGFAGMQVWRGRRATGKNGELLRDNAVYRALVFAFCCCAVPFAISCLIVYPRAHYFVTISVLAIALAFATPLALPESFRARQLGRGQRAALVAALCAVLVLLTGTKGGAATLGAWLTQSPSQPGLFGERQRAIVYLQSLQLRKAPLVVLEDSWGTCLYAGYVCKTHERWEKQVPFDELVKNLNLDVVVIDERLLADPHFKGDPELEDFLQNPERHGFVLENVPATHMRIAYRPALRP